MRKVIKKIGKYFISKLYNIRVGEEFIRNSMKKIYCVRHEEHVFKFVTPNNLNLYRAKTFSTKEPETLEWIDQMDDGSCMWDIGANVGLYTIYAAKHRRCEVIAFEPSFFNLELLARNIFINNVVDSITIISSPLNFECGGNQMKFTNTDYGGAMSAFGANYGHDGEPLKDIFYYKTYGFSVDQIKDKLSLPQPDWIKMDVDGIEHLILKGGTDVLKKVKGVLIEINDQFTEQNTESKKILDGAGLELTEKRMSPLLRNAKSDLHKNTFNQIWLRK